MTNFIDLLTIVNIPVTSNCHVLIDKVSHHCIVVDPGSEFGDYIDGFLHENSLIPDYIILTHEHFDHIWSCGYLTDKYQVPILCSKACADAIVNEKTNLSLFFDNAKAFACPPASLILEEIDYKLNWYSHELHFFPALGHSIGGIIFTIENYVITGDTLIKDLKTVTKLKCGSKDKLNESLSILEGFKGQGMIVCAGHGDNFALDDYDLNKAIE